MKYIHPREYFENFCACTGKLGIWLHYMYLNWTLRHVVLNIIHPNTLGGVIAKNVLNQCFNITAAKYADKYGVRKYVSDKGYANALLECYGVWDDPEKIPFEQLPKKFAMKATNGCSGHVFCHDKNKLDIPAAIKKVKAAMELRQRSFNFEPHYRLIPPRVYCEELMELKNQTDIVDYKFHCVKGKVNSVLLVYNRTDDGKYCLQLKDKYWNEKEGLTAKYKSDVFIAKPQNFDQMVEMAQTLSADFDFVRVDLYEYNGKVYFGELTFTPQGGNLAYFTLQYHKEIAKEINSLHLDA